MFVDKDFIYIRFMHCRDKLPVFTFLGRITMPMVQTTSLPRRKKAHFIPLMQSTGSLYPTKPI